MLTRTSWTTGPRECSLRCACPAPMTTSAAFRVASNSASAGGRTVSRVRSVARGCSRWTRAAACSSADADVSTGAGTIPENEECTTCSGSPRRAASSDAARTTGSSRSSAFTPATIPERKRRSRCGTTTTAQRATAAMRRLMVPKTRLWMNPVLPVLITRASSSWRKRARCSGTGPLGSTTSVVLCGSGCAKSASSPVDTCTRTTGTPAAAACDSAHACAVSSPPRPLSARTYRAGIRALPLSVECHRPMREVGSEESKVPQRPFESSVGNDCRGKWG